MIGYQFSPFNVNFFIKVGSYHFTQSESGILNIEAMKRLKTSVNLSKRLQQLFHVVRASCSI